MNDLDFLVIGHVCKDLPPPDAPPGSPHGVGGTATYAALTAHRLGRRVGIVTRAAPDFHFDSVLDGIEVIRCPSPVTTTFQNIYTAEGRRQFILAVADPLDAECIPPAWRNCPLVLFGPVAQEVPVELVSLFPHALTGATPQGWMREWDEKGQVRPVPWAAPEQVLPFIKVLILSEEDVGGDLGLVTEYARLTEIVALTTGRRGSIIYHGGRKRHFAARPAREVDPTGAGDVYAAAYLVRLAETDDPWQSARFANVVASCSVEKPGLAGIPDRRKVEACLAEEAGSTGSRPHPRPG